MNILSIKGWTLNNIIMKKFVYLFTVLLFAVGLSSCDEDKEVKKLELSTTSIDFESDANSRTIYVYSNVSWSASSSVGWCDVSPYYGNGDGSIRINVDKNTSTSSRSTTISIYGGSQTSYLNIYQTGSTNNGDNDNGGGNNTTISAPTGITATKDGTQVYITWNSISGASSYKVYRSSSSSGSYSSIGAATTTYKYDSSPLTGYNYYKVTAVSSNGTESSMSESISCNFTSGGGENTDTKPSAPTGVRVANEGNSLIPMITIRWNSVSNATSYKVYRSTSASGTYYQIGSTTTNTVLVDDNPREGTTYYKVTATNSVGESDYSTYASVEYKANDVSPCPVTYGNCTASGGIITMRWTNPTTSGCGTPTKAYLRVMNPISGVWADIETLSATATSASFAYGMWADSEGYVYVGIITENDKGTSGGVPKVYDIKNNRWIN